MWAASASTAPSNAVGGEYASMESLLLSGSKAQPEEIQLLDRMYKLRHTVFAERLQWTSLNNSQREIDLYDVINPVYLICRDPAGEVVGCWRLMAPPRSW